MEQKADPIEFWKSCNTLEKVLFFLAQGAACILPFTLLAMLWYTSLTLWIVCFITLIALGISKRKRTGEKFSISIIPKIRLR